MIDRIPTEKSLAFQVRRVHLAFARLLEGRLAKHDLKLGYWYYLRALGLQDNVTQRHLSEATKVTETTTVALLKGMEKQGLVTRRKDTVDRRKVFVSLTKKGRELESSIIPYVEELNDIADMGISDRDIKACLSVLWRMADNLEYNLRRSTSADK